MAIKARVTTRGGQKIQKVLDDAAKKRKQPTVEVGFFSTARYSDTKSGLNGGGKREPHYVATVAAWQEFGTNTIPERPFFRQSVAIMERDLPGFLAEIVNPETMLITEAHAGVIGDWAVGIIKDRIYDLDQPPNAEITIKGGWMRSLKGKPIYIQGKGSSNPLINEGILLGSVAYNVTA